jgi:hypothetical protein
VDSLPWAGVNWTTLLSKLDWTWTVCGLLFITSRPTEYRTPSWIIPLFVAAVSCLQNCCIVFDYPLYWLPPYRCYGTVAWQWLFSVYSLLRIWVLSKRWLAMDVCSASDIPAFRQHATMCNNLTVWKHQECSCFQRVEKILCSRSCSLATAVVLSPVYTAVTWQWVYMSQHVGHFLSLL